MGTEIPSKIRYWAEDLYVVEGYTYEQVHQATGVSVSQLKRWGKAEKWRELRAEYRKEFSQLHRDEVKARAVLLKELIAEKDPQVSHAYTALAKLAMARKALAPTEPIKSPIDPEKLDALRNPADVVGALHDALIKKLFRLMKGVDDIDLKKMKQVKHALELVEKMKAKYAPEETPQTQQGLSDEAAEEIRKQILGIS